MKPFPSIFKRAAILVFIILSTCGIALSMYAQQADLVTPQATQSTSGIMPSYVPRTEILHELPRFRDTAADSNHNKLYVTNDGSLTIIDTQLGIVETTLTNIHYPESLLLSPDGSRLYISSSVFGYEDGQITILDTESLTIVDTHVYTNSKNYPYYSSVHSMALGPTNKLYFAPGGDYLGNSIDTMDPVSGEIVATLPFSGYIVSLASQDNTLFASHSTNDGDSKLFKYDISTGTPITETAVTTNASGYLTLTPDDSTLLIRGQGEIHQYNATTLQFIRTYSVEDTYGFWSLTVSQNSQSLIGLHFPNGFYGPSGLQVFDLATGEMQRTYEDDNNAGVYPTHDIASFADDTVALIGSPGVRIITPADYQIGVPLVLKNYCNNPLQDDFSNPISGWPSQDAGSTVYRYINNEYNIYHRNANRWSAVSRGDVWNNSKLVQVSGRVAQNQGMWGLLFGLNSDWTDFYTFEISPYDQKWYFFHYTSGAGWQLIDRGSSTAIQPGSALNTLSIYQPYSSAGLQINGTWVAYPSHVNGRVGLTGASFQNNVDIRYDNYIFVDQYCPMPTTNTTETFTSEVMNLARPNIEGIPQLP